MKDATAEDFDPFEDVYATYSKEEFLTLNQPWVEGAISKQHFESILKVDIVQSSVDKYKAQPKQTWQEKKSSANPVKVQRIPCDSCNHRFTSKYALMMHTYLEHKGYLFLCPISPRACKKSFKSKAGLKYHVHNQHKNEAQAYGKGEFSDLVIKVIEEGKGAKKAKYDHFFITRNEMGSPKLVKYDPKSSGEESASPSSSSSTLKNASMSETSEEEQSNKPVKSKRETGKNVEKANVPSIVDADQNQRTTRSRIVSKPDPAKKLVGGAVSFEARYKKMYKEFSDDLKESADKFPFLQSVLNDPNQSPRDIRASQGKIFEDAQKHAPAKKKLDYTVVDTKFGKKRKEPPGFCQACGKHLSRKSDKSRHWTYHCKKNPTKEKLFPKTRR